MLNPRALRGHGNRPRDKQLPVKPTRDDTRNANQVAPWRWSGGGREEVQEEDEMDCESDRTVGQMKVDPVKVIRNTR